MKILFIGNQDIGRLAGVENSARRQRLLSHFQAAFGRSFQPTFQIEPGFPIRLLRQQVQGLQFPAALQAQNLTTPYYCSQFQSRIANAQPAVLVWSIEPDLRQSLWQHKKEGFLFSPEPGWTDQWPQSRQEWLHREFNHLGQTTPEQYEKDLAALVNEFKETFGAAILIMNASSIDPADDPFTYRHVADTLSVRINRFNLALLQLSMAQGLAIIDIDRLAAELGSAHIPNALDYSDTLYDSIAQELVRIIFDLDLTDHDQDIYRLEMPYVDLAVREGVVTTWHKKVGDPLQIGDKLVDLEMQHKKMSRTHSAHYLIRKKSKKVGGSTERVVVQLASNANGALHKIYAQPGSPVRIGSLLAAITATTQQSYPALETELAAAARFKVSAQKLTLGERA